MAGRGPQRTPAILIAAALAAALIVAFVARIWAPKFDVVAFISVFATVAIAFLTVSYVVITSGQLEVMRAQLEEMARTRELEAQPLPYLELVRMFLERPQVFHSPTEHSYPAATRAFVEYRLQNRGSHPAVNVIATARLVLDSSGNRTTRSFGAREIGLLGPGAEGAAGTTPPTENLMSTSEYSTETVSALRDRSYASPPLLGFRVLYRNLLGACFSGTWQFLLACKSEEDFDVLGSWESHLVSFEAKYKERLTELKRVRNKEGGRWQELFDDLRGDFDASLLGEATLELASKEQPNSYRASILDKEAFAAEIHQYNFGIPLPEWQISACPGTSEDDAEA